MIEAEWLTCDDAQQMFRAIPGELLANRKLLLFTVATLRTPVSDAKPDAEWLARLELTERLADGEWVIAQLRFRWGIQKGGHAPPEHPHEWASNLIGIACHPKRLAHLSSWRGVMPAYLCDIFGNPFRPVTFPAWRTDTVLSLARQMYESRDFYPMPILADALQDAGCDNNDVLNHCRQPGEHVRGCWVVDLILGKQ